MSPLSATRWTVRVSAILLLVALASACDDKRRHLASDSVEFASVEAPVPKDAPPAEVVRALLAALRDAQHARAKGLGAPEARQGYDAAMGRVVSLAARRAVHRGLRGVGSPNIPKDISEQAAVTLVSESWVSIVAHYADGIMFESLSGIPKDPDFTAVITARVEAERPDDRARLGQIEAAMASAPPAAPSDEGVSAAEADRHRTRDIRVRMLEGNPASNYPIRVQIVLKLRHEEGAWRATWVGLEAVP